MVARESVGMDCNQNVRIYIYTSDWLFRILDVWLHTWNVNSCLKCHVWDHSKQSLSKFFYCGKPNNNLVVLIIVPPTVVCGKQVTHNNHLSKSIWWFLEEVVYLANPRHIDIDTSHIGKLGFLQKNAYDLIPSNLSVFCCFRLPVGKWDINHTVPHCSTWNIPSFTGVGFKTSCTTYLDHQGARVFTHGFSPITNWDASKYALQIGRMMYILYIYNYIYIHISINECIHIYIYIYIYSVCVYYLSNMIFICQ